MVNVEYFISWEELIKGLWEEQVQRINSTDQGNSFKDLWSKYTWIRNIKIYTANEVKQNAE